MLRSPSKKTVAITADCKTFHSMFCFLVIISISILTGCFSPDGAQADPAEEKDKKYTNLLAKETSPYLLMHAHNPVNWYPWGPAAFEKAKKEKKVIFLSVGYSSCHWCHVMERESFLDKEIAEFHKAVSHVSSLLGVTDKGYRVLSNIGSDGGQEVPHLHFHIFAGEKIGKMVA